MVTMQNLACGDGNVGHKDVATKKGIVRENFGEVDGRPVYLFTLRNGNDQYVKITNYGGIVTSWITNDKNGKPSSVVLGFDSLAEYFAPPPYFGALVGRYANRIAKGKFKIGDSTFTLATNNGSNHLHGGVKGFDKHVWEANVPNDSTPTLLLSYLSGDGEEGFPGNLRVNVRYHFSDSGALEIEYDAETDKPTVLNLSNHSYFNLTGDHANTILGHTLMINADAYTPVDSTLIPTGEERPVSGTPFDFKSPHSIGERIAQVPGGYDHNFILNRRGTSLELVAVLADSISGRKLEVFTTQPGVQFYTGNFLDGTLKDSKGQPFKKNSGLCLETQHFPDSPNHDNFPTTLLKPGEKFHSATTYRVSLQ